MVKVYSVGEDPVTRAIIRRLIKEYAPHLEILHEEPVRGSQLKGMIAKFNKLAMTSPVVLLEDLDTEDCAPEARRNLLRGLIQSDDFIVNIAVDEAEAWLYADSKGLSQYLKVPLSEISSPEPQMMGGPHARMEVNTPIKASMHLTKVLINSTSDEELLKMIKSPDGRCKGKEYNTAIVKFVDEVWNPEAARVVSYSLDGMIRRIQALDKKYSQE